MEPMVCGIVNEDAKVRLRGNVLQGFGGSAIPLSRIFEAYPELKRLEKPSEFVPAQIPPESLVGNEAQPNPSAPLQQVKVCHLVIPIFREGTSEVNKVRFDPPRIYPQRKSETALSLQPQPLLADENLQSIKQKLAIEDAKLSISLKKLPKLIEGFIGLSLYKYSLKPSQLIIRLYLPIELLRGNIWIGDRAFKCFSN